MWLDMVPGWARYSPIERDTDMDDRTVTQQNLTAHQFGAHASAYRASTAHAAGKDLVFFSDRAKVLKPSKALDVGCGAGHAAFAIAQGASTVVACDPSEKMLEEVKGEAERRGIQNIVIHQGSVMDLPFRNGEFDLVITRYSAHHWPDLVTGFGECVRVLRPGGHLLITDSISPESALLDSYLQTVEVLRDPSHVRSYRLSEWREISRSQGVGMNSAETWKQPIDFQQWIDRLGTAPDRAAAVCRVFREAPSEVREHFQTQADCSFLLDVFTAEFATSTSGSP